MFTGSFRTRTKHYKMKKLYMHWSEICFPFSKLLRLENSGYRLEELVEGDTGSKFL